MNRKEFLHILSGTALGLWTGCSQSRTVSRIEFPSRGLCAHRGAMDTHPENTLAAFSEAIRHGAHMIELDVYLTKDDQLVVIHDTTVDRTTDGSGAVADMTLDELKKLDAGRWKLSRFEGERIPTLKEALDVMPINLWLNVHLKGGAALGESAASVIAQENRLHQAFLACDAEAANGAKTIVPTIMICNMARQSDSWDYVNSTIDMRANFIQLSGPLTDEFPEYTARLKDNGVRINYFGTDDPDVVTKLFDLGVDFPLVNTIGTLMKSVEKWGLKPLTPAFRRVSSPH